MMMADLIFVVQVAATLAMVGLIWFVQVVHYPLFARVGPEAFATYERAHQQLTTTVVAPLMLAEAATAVLLFWMRPEHVTDVAVLTGVILLAVVWCSTFFWQVPIHTRLGSRFDGRDHRRLVRSNWLRTAAWTARGLLVCYLIV